MFVRDENAGQVFGHPADGFEAFADLPTAEPRINENARFIGFKIRAVPGRTAAEDREVNSHASL